MKTNDLQRVFKRTIAGQLIIEGYKLVDIHPNKNFPDLLVYRFVKTENLLNRLNELKSIDTSFKKHV